MNGGLTEIKSKGKTKKVPSAFLNNRTIIVIGKWLKISSVRDEEWLEGPVVEDPELLISAIKDSGLKADIFTFRQKLPLTGPKYNYPYEWDNVAAIPITSYKDWWEGLPQVTRRNVRIGTKRGVVARVVGLDDELVKGIIEIHNDTPTRQGRPFMHYGKDFQAVKKDYGTFQGKSEFIGAYYGEDLVGIIKLIYMDRVASIMQIITKTAHYDKRPTNVLLAKAVEVSEKKGFKFLVFCKYVYGNKVNNSLTEFKHRNGFKKIQIPAYYIPLTLKGEIAIKLKLHLGPLGILPERVIKPLRNLRSGYYRIRLMFRTPGKKEKIKANEVGCGLKPRVERTD